MKKVDFLEGFFKLMTKQISDLIDSMTKNMVIAVVVVIASRIANSAKSQQGPMGIKIEIWAYLFYRRFFLNKKLRKHKVIFFRVITSRKVYVKHCRTLLTIAIMLFNGFMKSDGGKLI